MRPLSLMADMPLSTEGGRRRQGNRRPLDEARVTTGAWRALCGKRTDVPSHIRGEWPADTFRHAIREMGAQKVWDAGTMAPPGHSPMEAATLGAGSDLQDQGQDDEPRTRADLPGG